MFKLASSKVIFVRIRVQVVTAKFLIETMQSEAASEDGVNNVNIVEVGVQEMNTSALNM